MSTLVEPVSLCVTLLCVTATELLSEVSSTEADICTYIATDTVAATANATVAVALVKVSTEADIARAIVTVTDTVAVETLDSYSFPIYTSDSI